MSHTPANYQLQDTSNLKRKTSKAVVGGAQHVFTNDPRAVTCGAALSSSASDITNTMSHDMDTGPRTVRESDVCPNRGERSSMVCSIMTGSSSSSGFAGTSSRASMRTCGARASGSVHRV